MGPDRPVACRLCGAPRLVRLGAIPDSDHFAGRVLAAPLPGGELWRCEACGSMFRHPVLPAADYLALYVAGEAGQWQADGDRRDLAVIRARLATRDCARGVLDVGCGSGGFLATLPAGVPRFGVEPSLEAAAAARRAGVEVLAPTLDALPAEARFDAITIIDVIEHLADPLALLDQALAHLAPGGWLVVATGDPAHPAWRGVFRARFWYSSFPEHVTFPSGRALADWGARRGLAASAPVRLRYRALPAWRRAVTLASMLLHLASPAALDAVMRGVQALRRAPAPRRRHFSPGGPGVFADHQVVTLVRPADADADAAGPPR